MYEALMKLPGVMQNPSGGFSLNGKGATVWIDGQPTGLSGQDMIGFINSLPANVVEKIEMITNPGASYDANSTGGIINIITNPKTFKGFSGTLNSSYTYSRYNKYGTSLSLLGKVKKLGWQFLAGANHNISDEQKNIINQFTDFQPNVFLKQSYFTKTNDKSFFNRTTLNYDLTKQTTIGLKYNFNTNKNMSSSNGLISADNTFPSINTITSNNPTDKNTRNEIILYLKNKMDQNGSEMTILGDWSVFDKNNFNPLSQSNTYSIVNKDLKIDNKYLKIDFSLPNKNKDFTINFGSKVAYNKVKSNGKYNMNNTNSSIFDNPIYNSQIDYQYKETNYAAYFETKKKFDKWSFMAGLRVEHFKINSEVYGSSTVYDRKYTNVFPSINFLYHLSKIVDYSISYSRKVQQPNYSDLDPNINGYYDSFTTNSGNPNLQLNFNHNFETRLSLYKFAYLGFNYTYSNSQNFLVLQNLNNLKTNQTTITTEGLENYNFSAAIPIPFGLFTDGVAYFKKPININKVSYLYFIANCNIFKINHFDTYFSGSKPFFSYNVYSQIILPYDTKLVASYFLTSKGTYNIYQINSPMQRLDLSISRSFLNNTLKVTASANDLLHSYKINALSQSNNLYIDYNLATDTHSFRLGLSYNFGKFSALHKQKEINEDDNEKNRVEKKSSIGVQ
ncbi:TonB-dependent receptor [Flavobacterium branchiophilum]|uniref:outer membrane beta-barrel protein n=1 Tax=Flavobacterium branchiophilum TaxID=55197 RepID=UPI0002F996BB|nr:outer membrane beta-barrel protein [Flavobacterium branchiophilum]